MCGRGGGGGSICSEQGIHSSYLYIITTHQRASDQLVNRYTNRPFSPRDEEFDSTSGGNHNQVKTASGGSHSDMNQIKFKA